MKGNIVSFLRDREINKKVAPYFSTSKIVRRLIHSDKELYTTKWSRKSNYPIFYKNETLIFQDYKAFYISVSSIKRNYIEPSAIRSVEDFTRIYDAIVYSGLHNIENTCQCELNCICFSQCLFSISELSYLDQHLLANGRIVRRVYLGQEDTIEYRDCDWVTPNERFSLIGYMLPAEDDMDDILYLMVFTVPLELHVLLEIKEMVFPDVKSVKLFQNLLIVQNSTYYIIYRFDEFIKQGKCDICSF